MLWGGDAAIVRGIDEREGAEAWPKRAAAGTDQLDEKTGESIDP